MDFHKEEPTDEDRSPKADHSNNSLVMLISFQRLENPSVYSSPEEFGVFLDTGSHACRVNCMRNVLHFIPPVCISRQQDIS